MFIANVDSKKELQIGRKEEHFTIDGNLSDLRFERIKKNIYRVFSKNKVHQVEILEVDRSTKTLQMKVNGKSTEIQLRNNLDQLLEKLGIDKGATAGIQDLKAPMPGLVLKISIAEGQAIKKGDALLILEAMKMENVIKAQGDAVVKSINVKEGETVEKNHVMVTFSS